MLVALRIENWAHIERAYGEEVAQAICEGSRLRLTELLRGGAQVVPGVSGAFELEIFNPDILAIERAATAIDRWLAELCQIISMAPIETPGGPVHLWVSGDWALPEDIVLDGSGVPARWGQNRMNFHGALAGDGTAWAVGYRADMAKVNRVFSVLGLSTSASDGDQACLFWQSIRDAGGWGMALYHEALWRRVDRLGVAQSAVEDLAALERLGFIGLFDKHVVSQVVDELGALEASSDVWLGVNISVRSLCSPALWDGLIERLRSCPELACRLFIEIAETAPIPDMVGACRLIEQLRGLGCQIVLDDFGMGNASIRHAIMLKPSVVKIDEFFLHRAQSDPNGRAMLAHLVGLAKSLNSTVVIEGVKTEEQAELALGVGVAWQQGWHLGRPSVCRPWRLSAAGHDNLLTAGHVSEAGISTTAVAGNRGNERT